MPSPGILRRGQSPASPHQLSAAEVAAVITLDVAQTSTHVHMDLPFCNRPGEQHTAIHVIILLLYCCRVIAILNLALPGMYLT